MIQQILNIVDKNFMKVNILNGVRRIQYAFYEKNVECFLAYDNETLVGIVTKKELIGAHPNRIVADVMCNRLISVDCYAHIWNVKEIFDLNKYIDIVLVKNEDAIEGYISRTALNIELGKHIDLLTGLYKSEYMFYNAYNLIRLGTQLSILFIDLDNFGYIDKKYGHINGDTILKKVANILKDTLESNSYLCRYAGDEFAIVTPYCIEDTRLLAEKIVSSINTYPFFNGIPVSASIGITGCRINNAIIKNISELINKLVNIASLASTKAKQNVNNSIIIEDIDINAIA